VATSAFADADATVPLEDIARAAGVGIGTLYRHFPTREALVEAVYATELDEITRSAAVLLEQLPPDAALRAWMNRYAQFAELKRGLVDTLRAGWASGRLATPTTRERVTGAIATILTAHHPATRGVPLHGAQQQQGSGRAPARPDPRRAAPHHADVAPGSSGVLTAPRGVIPGIFLGAVRGTATLSSRMPNGRT
jgi:AcrR family transcriptional regulator